MSHIAKQTTSTRRTIRRPLARAAVAAAMLTLALTGQAYATQDLRSPDARDAALQAAQAAPPTTYQDLRSPDARDAALQAAQAASPTTYQDLRSPDARDAALRAAQAAPPATYQDLRSPDARDAGRVAPPAPEAVSTPASDGFNWGYLAIGGGALLLLAGVGMWTRRSLRPHGNRSVPTS